jgi:hypothetical protein
MIAAVPTAPDRRAGLTLYQSLMMLLTIALLVAGSYFVLRQQAMARQCQDNLRVIYMALEMYEIERGHLPNLSFFPDNPADDNDSLMVELGRFGVTPRSCVCPATPAPHRELGLTYIWNTKVNGKQLQAPGERTWLLVELGALSDELPAPHFGCYHVLYSDGKIERSRVAPPGIQPL